MSRQLGLMPVVPSVEAAKKSMRSAMIEADTVIGTEQFDFLVYKNTRRGDVRLTVTQAHEEVTHDLYVKRLLARKAALRLHSAGLSQFDGSMDR
jgi:hypothetical protein